MTPLLLGWCAGSLLVALMLLYGIPTRIRGHLLFVLLTFVCLAMALATGALAVAVRTYTTLTLEQPVATVRCARVPNDPWRIRLLYTPLSPSEASTHTVELAGDQWMVSGDFLKWHPWLTVAGWRPVHKVTRLSGRFADTAQELTHPSTAVALNGGTDAWWLWLHRYGRSFPCVETVYGSAAYALAESGRTYTVYVTPSGYIVK